MEKDGDAARGSYTAEFWHYSPNIARRWNVDPVEDIGVSSYATFSNNPIYYNDPNGDCPWCIGAGVGGIIGAVASFYDLAQSEGGWGAVKKLAAGDSKAWLKLAVGTTTGALVGSGLGGVAGAIGFSMGGNITDQLIQKDIIGGTEDVDITSVFLSGAAGGLGYGLGKIIGKYLGKHIIQQGGATSKFAERTLIRANSKTAGIIAEVFNGSFWANNERATVAVIDFIDRQIEKGKFKDVTINTTTDIKYLPGMLFLTTTHTVKDDLGNEIAQRFQNDIDLSTLTSEEAGMLLKQLGFTSYTGEAYLKKESTRKVSKEELLKVYKLSEDDDNAIDLIRNWKDD